MTPFALLEKKEKEGATSFKRKARGKEKKRTFRREGLPSPMNVIAGGRKGLFYSFLPLTGGRERKSLSSQARKKERGALSLGKKPLLPFRRAPERKGREIGFIPNKHKRRVSPPIKKTGRPWRGIRRKKSASAVSPLPQEGRVPTSGSARPLFGGSSKAKGSDSV